MKKIFEDISLRKIVVEDDEEKTEVNDNKKQIGELEKHNEKLEKQENEEAGEKNLNFSEQNLSSDSSSSDNFPSYEFEGKENYQSRFFMESLRTADPVSLLLMCYSIAKSSIRKAIEGIQKKDYEMKYEGVVKALRVFDVLMAVTEPNEVGKRLISSYLFITQKITEADIKKDISIFEKVIGYIEELERAWKEASIKEAQNRKTSTK
jgi:flagellar protein FliS